MRAAMEDEKRPGRSRALSLSLSLSQPSLTSVAA